MESVDMANIKIERLNHLIQQEISVILMQEVRDEDLKFVTITGCDTSSDYSYCKVYFTILDESKKDTVLEALDGASPFIRSKLDKHSRNIRIQIWRHNSTRRHRLRIRQHR